MEKGPWAALYESGKHFWQLTIVIIPKDLHAEILGILGLWNIQ